MSRKLRVDLHGQTVGHADGVSFRFREAWDRIEGDVPLAETHRAALLDHWQRVPLLEPLRR